MTSDADARPQNFEAALTELQELVDALEKGELTLEQSLATFERGIQLTRTCRKALDTAEQRVRVLSTTAPDAEPVPFESHE